ncbi:hypothetical protein CY35_07G021800 [Sphagnum magellanicum]|uniref:Uncharacterized protein n=1 Tax=Sphagnum magellanicum TaxID=128215 RepID=A0ACB8HJE3_9BRYO|nr:hypothetical protein CY35_07G021800 [Sphagnum magellanicum]
MGSAEREGAGGGGEAEGVRENGGMKQQEGIRKLVVGVCVMEKKALSGPMTQILNRLQQFGEFEIVLFGDRVILSDPIETWPICDCLIAFSSSGYPLAKVEAYADLRKPYLVNELKTQRILQDRRKVYSLLEECGIPVPPYATVNREFPYQDVDYLVEEEDYVEICGKRIMKPFVEKPVDGDDHNVMIYYPSSAGGGRKDLFRKVGNRSSEFHPELRRVRREGSYIYEEFMPTGGTDVKVYTVGPEYAHAEARKSPVVDGVVMRSADGKEVRYPVLLTPVEKQMAREVCMAFGQAVCGFDLLRSEGRSYVCDVNGWSFVKNSYKYYDDAASVLQLMLLKAKAPHLISVLPAPSLLSQSRDLEHEKVKDVMKLAPTTSNGTFGQSEELRCVIAVLRHGDRTPKAKLKMKVTQDKLLNLMMKYNGGRPRAEAKLKSAVQLQDLLDVTRQLTPDRRSTEFEVEDCENAEKLRHVKAVLEEGGHFSGIYRKVQLKPQSWVKVIKEGEGTEEERPTEALMLLKYGGVLTHAGRKQAEELGRSFRNYMYPGEGPGLLRLHSTYRHDLKIYSSDEGRVQMSAAAFAKGLLDLEGELTPIMVSLVGKDSSMLDGLDTASQEMDQAKAKLYEVMTSSETEAARIRSNGNLPWLENSSMPSNSLDLMKKLVNLTRKVMEQVTKLCEVEEERLAFSTSNKGLPQYDQAYALGKSTIDMQRIAAGLPCGSESFLLMSARWKKLEHDIYSERRNRYDISKVPDIYDSAKYDLLHNAHLKIKGLDELYKVAKVLADGVIPNEYGINPKHKLIIGAKIAHRLMGKILIDLRNTKEETLSVAELKKNDEENDDAAAAMLRSPKKLDGSKGSPRVGSRRQQSAAENVNDDDTEKETQYRLDPKYANVRTPERHVRTRLYFTSESHIHSLINILWYCHLDDSLKGEPGLVSNEGLQRISEIKELDYLTHIVLRMFENTAVPLEDPKRFRIELMFSNGAALSPLEATPRNQDHTLPVLLAVTLQEDGRYLTLDQLEKLVRPFAMRAEDFPPSTTPHELSGLFMKGVRWWHRRR